MKYETVLLRERKIDMSSSSFLNIIYFDTCVISVHIANSFFPKHESIV